MLAVVVALGGCGLGPGKERSGGATEVVTRDFGARQLSIVRARRVREDQSVLRLLSSARRVETRYGGRFVQSIDGLSGHGTTGTRDWFFFVNGIESDRGAAEYDLSPGDVVQWDFRDWRATMSVPAIVGAYPEPFLRGLDGKRFPVRIECGQGSSGPCAEAKRRLTAAGVPVSASVLGAQGTQKVIRVIVAPWSQARTLATVAQLMDGPRATGVFARFEKAGDALDLLGPGGQVVRRAPPGTGLVAALAPSRSQIVWVVTALDGAGLEAAARALDRRVLRNAFAVAATAGGVERLPLGAGG